MEVGLFCAFRNPPPWARPPEQLYADCLEQIRFAEELGFDGVWIGEHHFTDDGFAPSVMTLAAAVAAVTTRVQIGTYVLLLPQHHPVRVAEAAATVDVLSGGRLILGLGLGYRTREFEPVGLDYHHRGALMDESLEVLVNCFTEDEFSYDGRYFQLSNVAVTPKPVQQPTPRIIFGGWSEAMLRRAARFGVGLAIAPSAEVAKRLARMVEENGRDPREQRHYGMALGFVGETDDAAWELAKHHAAWEIDHYNGWFLESGLPKQFARDLREECIFGSPEQWIAAVEQQFGDGDRRRCDHLVVELTVSGMAHADVMRGLELFGKEVLPGLHAL